MKLTSVSKSALAAMLVSGVLVASPVLASADSASDASNVTIQTTKGKAKINDDLKISVKDNDDGTKTISITVPNGDVTKDGSSSLNDASYDVKTDGDDDNSGNSQTNVSSGDVKKTDDQNNAKFKIDLNKSALDNDQLMNDNLTITVKDSSGKTLGTISGVTANDLLKAAQQQKEQKDAQSQSSSSSQSGSSASSSSASSKKDDSNQNSAVIPSSDKESDPSGALISSNGGDDSSNTSNSGTDTDVSSASNSSSKKASDSSSKGSKNNPGTNTSEANGNASNDASDSQTGDAQSNGGSSDNGNSQSAVNGENTPTNSNSSSSSSHQQNYQNINQLIAAIKKNGAGSVRGANVTVTPANVQVDNDGARFEGGSNTLFSSSEKPKDGVLKNGQPVEVTVSTVGDSTDYNTDGDGRNNNGNYDYYITYSNARTPDKSGGQNGQQPSQGNNGQGGQNQAQNADQGTGDGQGDNSELPQTANGGIYQASAGIFGLIGAALAGLGLKKNKKN